MGLRPLRMWRKGEAGLTVQWCRERHAKKHKQQHHPPRWRSPVDQRHDLAWPQVASADEAGQRGVVGLLC
jgi:hypothetical protein